VKKEIDMPAFRLSSATRFASALVSGLLFLSSASFASDYNQLFPGGAYAPQTHSRAYHGARSFSSYPTSTPSDYVSSHVCINGYRWITRETDRWDDPAQNAIPVRC
jgi:hypothetical protein